MPIDPNIPLSVQTSQFGTIGAQAIQQRRERERQTAADERANALLELRQEKFAVEKAEAENKIKTRDFSNFAVSTLEPLYGQDPKLIDEALQKEIDRVVPGSLESEPLQDALELHRRDPAKARQIFTQTVNQARSDKLIPSEDISRKLKSAQLKKVKVQTRKIEAEIIEKEIKASTSARKVELKKESSLVKANVTIDKIDKALDQTGFFTTGFIGSVTGVIPGTEAHNLEKTIDTIKANIGFSELRQMRESSPTGGALGSIAVRELEFLQAALSSLDKSQSTEQLRENLKLVKTHYENWKQTIDTSDDSQKTTITIQEGQTATHPVTKKRVIYRNGQWQPL